MIRASLDATVGDEATVQKIERRSQNKGRIQEVRGRQRTVRIGKAPGIRYVQMAKHEPLVPNKVRTCSRNFGRMSALESYLLCLHIRRN
jgi:hypothetical protein